MQKISQFRRFVASATTLAFAMGVVPQSAWAQSAGEPAPVAATADTAGPSEEERLAARTAFEAGTKAYSEGDYATAEAEFRKAHAAIPSPHAEYWIASALDKQNKEPRVVVEAYEVFLSNPGSVHVGEDKLNEANARVAELKKTLPARYTFTTNPAGASLSIDGVVQTGVTPLTVELSPGPHKIEVAQSGYDTSIVEIQVEGGSTVEQPLTLTQSVVPEPVPVAAAPAQERSLVPAYVTLGLGTAGLIAGTVFGILALDAKSQFDSNPSSDKADEVERNALIADMSFGVALTLGITGVVLLTASEPAPADAPAAAVAKPRLIVAPFASPTSGGAAARLTF